MPILNGVDAAKELKKLMPDVPIILFTQYAEYAGSLLLCDLAVDRIVSKSKGPDLMRHVKELLPPGDAVSNAP